MSPADPRPVRWAELGRSAEDPDALAATFSLVYEDLRRMARRYFDGERAGHTLQPTALVAELYLRLVGSELGRIASREQFFGFAATLLREILVDHARARRALKRGGAEPSLELDSAAQVVNVSAVEPESLIALHTALDRLAEIDPRAARVVELRYFVGLTQGEVGQALDLSLATVERDWAFARRWLARELAGG